MRLILISRTTCDDHLSVYFFLISLCDAQTQPPISYLISWEYLYNLWCHPSLSLPPSLVFSLTLSHILPVFRRRLFVLCCPSRKPVAYILSSKHRTPLYSAAFKALIKGRPGPWMGQLTGASAATANWEPSQYRPGRSASSGPVVARSTGAWPTVREGLSSSLLSTVRSTTTKGAPNNKGSPSAAPQTQTLVEQSRAEGVIHLVR